MDNNYSKLLTNIGELLNAVQEFKKDVIIHEKEVKRDIQVNSDFLVSQKDLLARMKSEVSEHNMEYRTNLEEITKYIQNKVLIDFDKHINKKIEDINNMIEPLVNKVVKFQDSVDNLEKVLSLSTIKLNDLVEQSNKIHLNHIKEMDRFSKELSSKKVIEDNIVTDKATLEGIVNSLVGEKLEKLMKGIGIKI
jgi:hypothetical protein